MDEAPKLAAKHLDRAGTSLGLGFLCYMALAMYIGQTGRDGTVALLVVIPFQIAVAWHVRRAALVMGGAWVSLFLALVSLLPPGSLLVLGHLYRKLSAFTSAHRRSLNEPA